MPSTTTTAFWLFALALSILIITEAHAPNNKIVTAIKGWQSGVAILFGFIGLIYSNQLQFDNNKRIEILRLTTDVIVVTQSLTIDVVSRQRELQGLTVFESLLDSIVKVLRPNGGWTANTSSRDSFCKTV
jgi:hypothetical protein